MDIIPALKPKEMIWSFSYSRLCLDFCTDLSFRRAAELINTMLHRCAQDSLKVRTLADFVGRVGTDIQSYLLNISESVLKNHNYQTATLALEGDKPGVQDTKTESAATPLQKQWNDEIIKKAGEVNDQREGREQIKNLDIHMPLIEAPGENYCHISIDDIGVKHQKESRKDGGQKSSKNVENTVVHIQNGGKSYYLTALGMDNAFRMLVAFLLTNNLMYSHSFVFFADGARNIRYHIEKYFASRPYILILDWYHLKKKCKELISSSLKGTKEQKNDDIQKLLRILWAGNVREAISYLNELPDSRIKNRYWLGQLTGYLERKEPQIVCYALRHELGLRVSSNRVEKANDLLVAKRQKHSGMSWSYEGSSSLASISMVMLNDEADQWLRTNSLDFSMSEKLAA